MSKPEFLGPNYFLESPTAVFLFHEIAQALPIVDYHNHINVSHLASNKKFSNIAELWVCSDPYKHRSMRINGVAEHYISGAASDEEKFFHWAKTFPKTMGNPLFHWSYLELKNIFGIQELLTEESAPRIWDTCNRLLEQDDFSARALMEKYNVETFCTSDNWFDDLKVHKEASLGSKFTVLPSLRCDLALHTDSWESSQFLQQLSQHSSISIDGFSDFKAALRFQLDYFHENGCRLADQALDAGFTFKIVSEQKAAELFAKVLDHKELSFEEKTQLQCFILLFLGGEFASLGWTMQLHVGAQRYTSSRLRSMAGAAGGYASIGSAACITSICSLLDRLEQNNSLPNTLLFTLNPSDNEAFATLTGSFAQDGMPGKIQFGPAWWFNDHIEGIKSQLLASANYSLLSRFVGMTTDSRSILSFSRHDYFRRILCNIIGDWVEKGLLPKDNIYLKELITDICYTNSKKMISNE
ncbi:glucuronate isomerase [Flavobacterium cupreum]|uniref:Uronate isomerase n=2 Tax=Flavobacterium TaxID=237 RepID=A0A4Y7UD81_9FLAO|nr:MULTISPECIES: glucuronate isomerase [Flavobacterium]RUT67983.1 glucuronate isomerase [Flavobacterium cupreum]TCN59009.1 glucuronate isomerase [Flavobacterium circumlabens]TEB44410.1 glucuronate isomerase [Flavobacterium circumlabens]